MGQGKADSMTFKTALQLGRVSNLPTVWTNVMVGIYITSYHRPFNYQLLLFLSFSLFYIGGMYLNDAFDAKYDMEHQPYRPIPSGQTKQITVLVAGFCLLGLGIIILSTAGELLSGTPTQPGLIGIILAASIVFYNWRHKGRWYAPAVMGVNRALVYIGACSAVSGKFDIRSLILSVPIFVYIIAITLIAKKHATKKGSLFLPASLLFLVLLPFVIFYYDEMTYTGYPRLTAVISFLESSSPGYLTLLIFFSCWLVFSLSILFKKDSRLKDWSIAFLIAGICILDALLIGTFASTYIAVIALAMFPLTLFLQKFVKGT